MLEFTVAVILGSLGWSYMSGRRGSQLAVTAFLAASVVLGVVVGVLGAISLLLFGGVPLGASTLLMTPVTPVWLLCLAWVLIARRRDPQHRRPGRMWRCPDCQRLFGPTQPHTCSGPVSGQLVACGSCGALVAPEALVAHRCA